MTYERKRCCGAMTVHKSLSKIYVFVGAEKIGTTTIFDLLPFKKLPIQKEMFLLSRRRDPKAEVARIEAQLAAQEAAFIVEPTYFVSTFARETLARLAERYDIRVNHNRRDLGRGS